MTTLDFAPRQSRAVRDTCATVRLGDDLWRVTKLDGEVIGYVERTDSPAGHRFTAKRLLPRQRRFLPIGDFWSVDDAMDCFRF